MGVGDPAAGVGVTALAGEEPVWEVLRWGEKSSGGINSTGTLNAHLSLSNEGFGCFHSTLLSSQISPRLVQGDGFSCWLEPGPAESRNIQQELFQVMDETGPAQEQEARPELEQQPQCSWQWRSTQHGRDCCPGVTPALFSIPRNPEGSVWSLPHPSPGLLALPAIISTKPH